MREVGHIYTAEVFGFEADDFLVEVSVDKECGLVVEVEVTPFDEVEVVSDNGPKMSKEVSERSIGITLPRHALYWNEVNEELLEKLIDDTLLAA